MGNYLKTWAYIDDTPRCFNHCLDETESFFSESFSQDSDGWNHDGSRLAKQDKMISDLIGIFQPRVTRDIYRGKLFINGER